MKGGELGGEMHIFRSNTQLKRSFEKIDAHPSEKLGVPACLQVHRAIGIDAFFHDHDIRHQPEH